MTEFERGAEAMRLAIRERLAMHQGICLQSAESHPKAEERDFAEKMAEYIRETIDLVNEIEVRG